jgi:LysR family glycine cleavage system transcriptional activator
MARAAADLHLTPGAVSKRITELEEWVATPLFERVRKKLVLSAAGASYLESIAPLLTQLEAATLSLMRDNGASGVLHMALLPTVAEKWLIPHLPEFTAAHPEVDLRFSNYFQIDEDVSKTTLDCLLRFGDGQWDDTESDYLFGREIVVIAPPEALRTQPLEAMDDLRRQPLIHHVDRPNGWAIWADVHGIADMDVQSGPHLSLASIIINAVSSGVGVALMPQVLVLQEIADGTVTMPFPPMLYGEGYYLCHRPGAKDNPAFQTFRHWLLELARKTMNVRPS